MEVIKAYYKEDLSPKTIVWLKEAWRLLKESGKIPTYKSIRLNTKELTGVEFDPNSIDVSLIRDNATQITFLGLLKIEPEERLFGDATKIINQIKAELKEDYQAERIELADVAIEIGLDEQYVKTLTKLITDYGSFWSNAGGSGEFFGFDHISIGQDERFLETYLKFSNYKAHLQAHLNKVRDFSHHNLIPYKSYSPINKHLSGKYASALDLQNSFVAYERMEELAKLKHPKFDLKKLVKLCEEINDCFSRQNYYATAMLCRAIIDHIPPVFQLKSFNEVACNYKSEKNERSFSKQMLHLNNSLRFIGDTSIHSQLRSSEVLPNCVQLDFRNDLDVLLGEVVRVLQKEGVVINQ